MHSIQLATATVNGHPYAVWLDPDSDSAQVTSRSNPGTTHRITGAVCDCTYFAAHRGARACAHLQAVAQVQQERRARLRQTLQPAGGVR